MGKTTNCGESHLRVALRSTASVQPPPCGRRQRHRDCRWYRFQNAKKPRSCAPQGGRLQHGVSPQPRSYASTERRLGLRLQAFGRHKARHIRAIILSGNLDSLGRDRQDRHFDRIHIRSAWYPLPPDRYIAWVELMALLHCGLAHTALPGNPCRAAR